MAHSPKSNSFRLKEGNFVGGNGKFPAVMPFFFKVTVIILVHSSLCVY